MRFRDRHEAGRLLARRLDKFAVDDVVVVGLPRGGVPVAYEVAKELGVPLDVILVRKLGAPAQPELAMGAIGESNLRVLNQDVIDSCGISQEQIDSTEAKERTELHRREVIYRSVRRAESLRGKTVVVVDDGIATGSTALAACRVARARGASWIVLAVPVAPSGWEDIMANAADEFISLYSPESFDAVGRFYEDFGQVSDEDVLSILKANTEKSVHPIDREVSIVLNDGVILHGRLTIPPNVSGCVIFVHGSGSSRKSPRNIHVATILNAAGLGTLLFDLLSEEESDQRENVFDIELLSARLFDVTDWIRRRHETRGLPLAYFGASTGAAAALHAAARDTDITAVVSRGGRPDLALEDLPDVTCPVLLIVGSRDVEVRQLNEEAAAQLTSEHHVAIVQRASHLFEETGTLDEAAHLARDFLVQQFSTQSHRHSMREKSRVS